MNLRGGSIMDLNIVPHPPVRNRPARSDPARCRLASRSAVATSTWDARHPPDSRSPRSQRRRLYSPFAFNVSPLKLKAWRNGCEFRQSAFVVPLPHVYDQLGVPRAINAAGTLTRLGGSLMAPEVLAAMGQAAESHVRIDLLQAAAGSRIAAHCGAEAALVTNGAAAGLTLAAAACICRDDFSLMDRLPDTRDIPCEIIVARSQRNGYDHAIRAAGARLVEVGLAERTRDPQPWELAAAVNAQTVALAWFDGFSDLSLCDVVTVARAAGVPVIVDASASLPPRANLRTFVAAGADLVVFSGGKAIRGPQSSGILCGRRSLVASAALQMCDMDYVPALWNPPAEWIDPPRAQRGVPNHGIGRGMKVGKEEIVGLWTALERFLAEDEALQLNQRSAAALALAESLHGLPDMQASLIERQGRWPLVRIAVLPSARCSALELVRRLEQGTPAIFPIQAHAPAGFVDFDVFGLQPGDAELIAKRLRELCG